LFWRLLAVQSVVLVLVVTVLFGSGQLFQFQSTENTVEILRTAIKSDQIGGFLLENTDALRAFRKDAPGRWFVIRDGKGHTLSEGETPSEYAHIGDALNQVGQARLGWNIGDPDKSTARMRWVETDAGRLQIMTGSSASAPFFLVLLGVSLVFLKLFLPILGVIALGAFVGTPIVVRRVMAGMERAAAQADSIDVEQRGVRLNAIGMPSEVAPFVRAVNGALNRLDEGYDRQERFLADAAHELRTPIAVLKTRVVTLPPSDARARLMEDAARLANLTEQMLDLQRLKQSTSHFKDIDLIELARRIVLDIGPLAFAAGYDVSFEPLINTTIVKGDTVAIERALTNLLQNAIDHGGRAGIITVSVGPVWIEVTDEGQGIPTELHGRIFEPFFKRSQATGGSGLGLKLVQDVMELHGGTVSVGSGSVGTSFRLSFTSHSAG
jgi:signal transduction histidine kinase